MSDLRKGGPSCKKWRFIAHTGKTPLSAVDLGDLDEVVIADWMHAERMDANTWWLQIGDRVFDVRLKKDGTVKTMVERSDD
jgi:hypothetical protein